MRAFFQRRRPVNRLAQSAWRTRAVLRGSDDQRFGLQFDTEACADFGADAFGQCVDLRAAGGAVVHQDQRVLFGNRGIAFAQALESAGFDEPRGGQLATRVAGRPVRQPRMLLAAVRRPAAASTSGFLKKLPALPISAGLGSLRVRMRAIASATPSGVGSRDTKRAEVLRARRRSRCATRACAAIGIRPP